MSREPARNLAASVRARLLTLAQEKGEDYQRILGKYAVERFLFRLGRSEHRDRFILKGAMLFTLWMGEMHRPTKDLDLLGWGSSALEEVEKTVREICAVEEDDGLAFEYARTLSNFSPNYGPTPNPPHWPGFYATA
jgi:predicted nucleotidyltransferase component of viral defense system